MLLLAGYLLLFPPLFVLGPLAALLLASRPSTSREWAWIGAAALWVVLSLTQPAGLAMQTEHAWALVVTAAFVTLMLVARTTVVTGALGATVLALGLVTLCMRVLGTGWQELQLADLHQGWEVCRAVQVWGQGLPADQQDAVRQFVDGMSNMVALSSALLPAILVLKVLPALAIAWSWYHRLASHPMGQPAETFAEFRFSDQLVWLVVLSVAVFVIPVPEAVEAVFANLLLAMGGLYVARGAAITWGTVTAFPPFVLVVVGIGMLFILPVALGGWFAFGLADTWVDFRRRARAADQTRE
jgi:hypothetical protein